MGKKQQKSKAMALTFRPFLATFPIFHKWEKSKAVAFTFRPFLATFPFFINGQKTEKK
jgi:hypothetical protein